MRDPSIPVSVDGEASQTMPVTYPVGNRPFHPIPTVNFELNRWLAYADEGEFAAVAPTISTFEDWYEAMSGLAEKATNEQRQLHASTSTGRRSSSSRSTTRGRCRRTTLIVTPSARASTRRTRRMKFPSAAAKHPAVRFPAVGAPRDVLVIHGGFDSYYEEFLPWGQRFWGYSLGADVPPSGGSIE
jgi:hypothetical protein